VQKKSTGDKDESIAFVLAAHAERHGQALMLAIGGSEFQAAYKSTIGREGILSLSNHPTIASRILPPDLN
jgi:hypothetical protein